MGKIMQINNDKARKEFINEGAELVNRLALEIREKRASYWQQAVITISRIISNNKSKS
jgi:hypothetical protein